MASIEQRVKAALRRKVLLGDYTPDDRISEVSIAEELHVSRTPARAALTALEAEGLIEKRVGRGYVAKQITPSDITKAIQVKAVLEGLAARFLSENGLTESIREKLEKSLEMTEKLAVSTSISVTDVEIYQEANTLFHNTIMRECGNEYIYTSFERIEHFPLLALGAFAFDPTQLERERMRLTVGHSQHVIIYHAIKNRDIARAETNMREHANAIVNYAELFQGQSDYSVKSLLKNIGE